MLVTVGRRGKIQDPFRRWGGVEIQQDAVVTGCILEMMEMSKAEIL